MKQSRTIMILVKDRTLAHRLSAILEPAGFHVNIALDGAGRVGAAPARAAAAAQVNSIDVSRTTTVTEERDVDGTPLERPYGIGNIVRLAALH